jgi:hypothetical protein
MKIIFTAFIAVMVTLMTIAVYAAKDDKKVPSDRLNEEVIESTGSAQHSREHAAKDGDTEGTEEGDEECEGEESSHYIIKGGGRNEHRQYDSSYFCYSRRA